MYSIKPGRGPSFLGGVGGIGAAVFGVIWTVFALSMGAPAIFALFGVVFVVMAVVSAAYNFTNAAGRNRMSTLDITTGDEEPDPIAKALGYTNQSPSADREQAAEGPRRFPGEFCPFCGAKAGPDFDYCPKCGKDI